MVDYNSTFTGAQVDAALTRAVRTASAWMSYKGTTTNAIQNSENVTSVTDSATGTFVMNFTNAFTNINHCTTTGRHYGASVTGVSANLEPNLAASQGITTYEGGALNDPNRLSMSVNGDLA